MNKIKIEKIPEKSNAEETAEDMFYYSSVETEADLDKIISHVFDEICGEHGKKEFFENALPAVKQVYGTNYRKAGLRLLEIIDKGTQQKPGEIGQYFVNAVSQSELEYSKKPKQEIVDEIITAINNLILEENREDHKGIAAVIIYGSFAKNNFSLTSDLDVIFISESEENEDCGEKFESRLNIKVRPPVENFYGTFYIGEEDKFRELVSGKDTLVKGGHIVVSPYPEIKTRIQKLLVQQ
ncbi:MAG TPA: nucleotidyltransferase domain-containing protein [Candidatus Paceibacterota bacterium]